MADGRSAVLFCLVEASASGHPFVAPTWTRRIRLGIVRESFERIPAPLVHIAVHIEQSPRIGEQARHGRGAAFSEDSITAEQRRIVAKRISSLRPGTA